MPNFKVTASVKNNIDAPWVTFDATSRPPIHVEFIHDDVTYIVQATRQVPDMPSPAEV